MFYKIKAVEPCRDFFLRVAFQNGETKYFDVAPLFDRWEAFRDLRDIPGLFQRVKVDAGGYGISWNDEIDLECNDLWEYGAAALPDPARIS